MRTARYLITTAALMIMSVCQSFADELVMVEQNGCHWCERWNSDIGHIYPKTEEGSHAPLRRVDLHALPDDIAFESRPVFTPTFVLVRDGRELARMEGYAGDEFFWFLLNQMLEAHPNAEGPSQ